MALYQLGAEVEPARPAQADVEQHDVGLALGGQAEGVLTVGRGRGDHHPAALGRKHRGQSLEDHLVVVDQQEAHRLAARVGEGYDGGDDRQVLPHEIHLRGEARRNENS